MQILYYEPGEKYGPHFDYFQDQTDRQLGGHRVATVLMYLSNDQNGGETILPQLRGKNATNGHSAEVVLYPHSAICVICRGNYQSQRMTAGQTLQKMAIQAAIPEKGDATTDPDSSHGSCPGIEGERGFM
ncbi:prolyl 4-hydroxylase [Musa troglodytarum]|uniref:Prolyl 4-hydroxylase n=1 Tax=Musa troglodytarum TaxID=320322 RepID=A0A9E7JNI6_9LILI|nr:prolyl 4-hydroxylase [Musa troglodytarum]